MPQSPPWICCQLGAREHYAIPRSLHQTQQLNRLITDAWVPPSSRLHWLPTRSIRSLCDRHHPALNKATVQAFTPSLIGFEFWHKLQKTAPWPRIIARNQWFQRQTLKHLSRVEDAAGPMLLFAYSYAALEILRYAKQRGWRTVLGQIDPGLVEEKRVLQEQANHPGYEPAWQPAPSSYWQGWQEECNLADCILVNSTWSKEALETVGIPGSKIAVVPLAYDAPPQSHDFVRNYPTAFSPERPLRVLFLGQIILRKGIAALLEAAQRLQDAPIEFWLVGSQQVCPPSGDRHAANIRWIGSVPRSLTATYYQQADVFLFPTLSDGFGLTQLEAQAWQLPIIASRYCGEVVKDQVNGTVLTDVSAATLTDTLRYCLSHPEVLAQWVQHGHSPSSFSLDRLSNSLSGIAHDLI